MSIYDPVKGITETLWWDESDSLSDNEWHKAVYTLFKDVTDVVNNYINDNLAVIINQQLDIRANVNDYSANANHTLVNTGHTWGPAIVSLWKTIFTGEQVDFVTKDDYDFFHNQVWGDVGDNPPQLEWLKNQWLYPSWIRDKGFLGATLPAVIDLWRWFFDYKVGGFPRESSVMMRLHDDIYEVTEHSVKWNSAQALRGVFNSMLAAQRAMGVGFSSGIDIMWNDIETNSGTAPDPNSRIRQIIDQIGGYNYNIGAFINTRIDQALAFWAVGEETIDAQQMWDAIVDLELAVYGDPEEGDLGVWGVIHNIQTVMDGIMNLDDTVLIDPFRSFVRTTQFLQSNRVPALESDVADIKLWQTSLDLGVIKPMQDDISALKSMDTYIVNTLVPPIKSTADKAKTDVDKLTNTEIPKIHTDIQQLNAAIERIEGTTIPTLEARITTLETEKTSLQELIMLLINNPAYFLSALLGEGQGKIQSYKNLYHYTTLLTLK
jgi:hypothetical protein